MGSRAKLSIGTAIQDGWHAFRLAPWAFVGFVLLSSLLAQLANVIPLFGALVATLVLLPRGRAAVNMHVVFSAECNHLCERAIRERPPSTAARARRTGGS